MIVYAENVPGFNGNANVSGKIAQILATYVSHRLRIKGAQPAGPPQTHVPPRRAPRIKIQSGTMVVVDDAKGALIDLSVLGAQVVSPHVLRPNSAVRLILPSETGGLSCAARVVWVLVEQNHNDSHALYRTGIQFTDAKTGELEAFFNQHGIPNPAIRH